MGKTFLNFAIIACALLLSDSRVLAVDPGWCSKFFVNTAVANAVQVRQLGGCGLNLNDESLSTDPSVQLRWCVSVNGDTVLQRQRELWGQTTRCDYCRNYAEVITEAAADNIKYSCGYKNDKDQRWNPDYLYHLTGCMAVSTCQGNNFLDDVVDFFGMDGRVQCFDSRWSIAPVLDPNISDVTSAIAQCEIVKSSSAALSSSDVSVVAMAFEAMRRRLQKAQARERMLITGTRNDPRPEQLKSGSSTAVAGTYTSQREIPSGGAGGSETPPAVVPSAGGTADGPRVGSAPASGGAGGSLNASSSGTATAVQAPQPPQQVCLNDPKSFGDAQLRLLLADPKIHARLTSLIAEEPRQPKTKTDPKKRIKRGRAPTDADIARSNSGMSPETANAIGTIIGVGMGVGLRNGGGRGASGVAPHRGASGAVPRRGTFDGPLR